MKLVMPVILIAIAVAVFVLFGSPAYSELRELRKEAASYDQALGNSKALESERDKLTAKYNSFSKEDLSRLERLLPDNVDNIRLILEIEQLAAPYGMALRNVEYTAEDTAAAAPRPGAVAQGGAKQARKDYGVLSLQFSVAGTYDDFQSFIRDLENNLRIVDISSISFSSNVSTTAQSGPDAYEYNIKVNTYWLKN